MKKGFTLVELLAVVVILGVLASITIPIVDGVVKRNKEKLLTIQKQEIITNINSYLANHIMALSKYDDIVLKINLLDVTTSGFGNYIVKDPVTDKYLDFYNDIIITKTNGDISINIDDLYLNQLESIDNMKVCVKESIVTSNNITVSCDNKIVNTTISKEQLTNNLLHKVYITEINRNVYVNYVGGVE